MVKERNWFRLTSKKLMLAATVVFTLATGGLAFRTAPRMLEMINKPNAVLVSNAHSQVPTTTSQPKQERPRRVWCNYEPKYDKLMVYLEKEEKPPNGSEIGDGYLLDVSDAFEGTKPLAVKCNIHGDGTVWWISSESIYRGVIIPRRDECCDIVDVAELSHTDLPEHKLPDTKMIAADIWWPVGEETPYAVTITNTGIIQMLYLPKNELITERPNKFNGLEIFEDKKWRKHIAEVVIKIIDNARFVVIPLGYKNSKSNDYRITFFYYIMCNNGLCNDHTDRLNITVMGVEETIIDTDGKKIPEGIRTIYAASPIRYNEEWVTWRVDLEMITIDGKIQYKNVKVEPPEVIEEKRKDRKQKEAEE